MPRGDGSRRGTKARSGPSGASTPRAARLRQPVEVTLHRDTVALLATEQARTEESRSALIEAAVLCATRPGHYLSPALIERAQRHAARIGSDTWTVLADALDTGLDGLEASLDEDKEKAPG